MDFYVILGVERDATPAEVERAYTRLARRYHPDINPGDREAEAFFRRVADAYQTLRDPARRREYDSDGAPQVVTQETTVEFQGFDFSTPAAGASATFGELFPDAPARPDDGDGAAGEDDRGGDLHGEIDLGFEEAWRGAARRLLCTRVWEGQIRKP